MTSSDDELLREAQSGEAQALATLLERHAPIVRARLADAIPRRWQALISLDDVMQEAFTDAFLSINRFEPQGEGAFAAWLTTLARHNLLDAIKMLESDKRGGKRRQVLASVDDRSYANLYDILASSITSPSGKAAGSEAQEALRQAIARLPANYRSVVELYDLQGRSVQDVSIELKRSPGAVYMMRSRAHRLLAETMGTSSQYLTGAS
jgi:RNA polymerase sigma-70 factor (ECF subfamily)